MKLSLPCLASCLLGAASLEAVAALSSTQVGSSSTSTIQSAASASTTAGPSPLNQFCSPSTTVSSDDTKDLLDWLHNFFFSTQHPRLGWWSQDLPGELIRYYNIPKSAFDCDGQYDAVCNVNKDVCWPTGYMADEVTNAWKALLVISKFRKGMKIMINTYFGAAPMIAQDMGLLIADFYNGAYGDSPVDDVAMTQIIGNLHQFMSYSLYPAFLPTAMNAQAVQVAGAAAPFNCSWYEASNGSQCLITGALAIPFELQTIYSQFEDMNHDEIMRWNPDGNGWFDIFLWSDDDRYWNNQWTDDVRPDVDILTAIRDGAEAFEPFLLRAVFMQIMKAQSVFIHREPLYDPTVCSDVIKDRTGYYCPSDGSTGQYITQLTAVASQDDNSTSSLDTNFAPIEQITNYNFNIQKLFDQSWECWQNSPTTWDLQNPWPSDGYTAMYSTDGARAKLDTTDVDSWHCLWNFPVLSWSEGPNWQGLSKAISTYENYYPDVINFLLNTASAMSCGMLCRPPGMWAPVKRQIEKRDQCSDCEDQLRDGTQFKIDWTERGTWKDSSQPDARVWNQVNDISYCQTSSATLGLGTYEPDDQLLSDVWGLQHLVGPSSPTRDALDTLQSQVCDLDRHDSGAREFKDIVDIGVGIVVGTMTSELCGACSAPLAQAAIQAVDDLWLDKFVDTCMKNNLKGFAFTGDKAQYVKDALGPIWSTVQPGDNDGGPFRGNPKNIDSSDECPTDVCPEWTRSSDVASAAEIDNPT